MKIAATILILFLSFNLFAQENDHIISGIVQEKTSRQPVEFATVELLKASDSTIVKSTVTDRKGKFVLEKISNGNYVLQCTFIGFEKILMPVTVKQKRENLGTIEIGLLTKDMSEVTVTSRKSLLNTSIDRKVYNVSQDIMAQSGSASDILKNIPSVEVDIEGQVMLRGSTDVLILINGRPSPLMGRTRAEVLQQLPANSIERIEVITNPSARYRPDGTSGIINIVLKKNIKGGWNGSIIANAGSNNRYNGNISLNYKPGRLNLYGNYSIRQDRRFRINNTNRDYYDSAGNISGFYNEDNQSSARPLSHFVNSGIDYTLNERNSLGLSVDYFYRDMIRRDVVQRWFYDRNHLLTGYFSRLRYDPEFEKEKDATLYWQHNFPEEDHELRIEFNTSSSEEKENNQYTNVYHLPLSPSSIDNTEVKEGDNQQQLTIEYSNPLSEDSKLEAGYLGSFNQIDLDFYVGYYDTVQRIFVKDINRSNRFTYNEEIHAAYATYQRSYDKFGYSAGLRAEQAFIRGKLVTKDSAISNRYFKVYPTLHLSYKLKSGELQLNYSKRVNRPDGDELNPFPEYQDPYNLRAGNPRLLPEIIHSVELGYKWQNEKFSFVPGFYYRYKEHGFTSVTIPLNDTVLLTTEQNLSNDQSAGLELIFSAKAGNFLSANLSSNFFYNRIDASDLGYSSNKSIYSMSANFNSTITLTKTTMMQLSCNYRSARLTPQGKSYSSFVLNAGVRQDFFKKKISLVLTASDILKTLRFKNELNTDGLRQVSFGKRDARVIYFGISYRFGKVIKKTNEEKMEFDNSL
ncbi:MAG TPA: TonB-dependent receptor [Chitinophagaceae bacterium]|nr:TonB-dependent receptor [Chitinophagaceae bacterium]